MTFNSELEPYFYYTLHPGDLIRSRLMPGIRVMLVASAHWDDDRKRFKVRRPPADWITSLVIDSGGFTAARRWGKYPWSYCQYAGWIRETSRDVALDFCAVMDYACEPAVNRDILATNQARIAATIENEVRLKETDPDLPWLPVLQGDNLAERAYDLELRGQAGLLPESYAGIGSVCGRGARGATQTTRFYAWQLPGVRFHGFGMHIQALDDNEAFFALKSWDSYGWNWGRGQKDMDRPPEYLQRPGESYSELTNRLGRLYWQNTISPRLSRDRQRPLFSQE